ncbi:MAG: methyltransferase [Gammaproteobacteria bacterium]|nr:methyltransferase [Gammaproteobacteria bacterium]
MSFSRYRAGLAGVLCALFAYVSNAVADAGLDAALAGAQRSEVNRARDVYRHPRETLAFFGVEPTMTVVEIMPGGGWYTEILAPWLREKGKLYAAHFPADSTAEYPKKAIAAFTQKLAAEPAIYDRVVVTPFMLPKVLDIAPPASADVVLTFRNVHNWLKDGGEVAVFKAAFAALKPGGVFGVVEHRAKRGTTREQSLNSGYTTEQLVIDGATSVGFVFEAKSEINANTNDTKDYAQGVWTLPPTYAAGEQDKAKYHAIGESDRMTLRFRKPAK